MSDKALREAERERAVADRERRRLKATDEWRQCEERARQSAEKTAEIALCNEKKTKSRYTFLFVGIMIFTTILAILNAYNRRNVLIECGQWFIDRGRDIQTFFQWLVYLFRECAGFFTMLTVSSDGLGYIIAGVIFATGLMLLGIAICGLTKIGGAGARTAKRHNGGGKLKAVITVSISISLFFVCLFFYEMIKSVTSRNIFSVWLMLSLVITIVVNLREIGREIKRW